MSTDTEVTAESIVDLDFPTPCAHSEHGTRHVLEEAAAYIVAVVCPHCGATDRYPLCASGWIVLNDHRRMVHGPVGCGWSGATTEFERRIVELLRDAVIRG